MQHDDHLQTSLDALKRDLAAKLPAEARQAMARAQAELEAAGLDRRALGTGDKAPDFTLPNVNGKQVRLSDCLHRGAVVLNFYRGGWCPYCNMELQALAVHWPAIRDLGADVLAIAPETPEHGRETAEQHGLPFPALWDVGNRAARKFGLVFSLPETLRPVYAGLGIDLPAWNGNDSFELPMPATYVVGEDGRILDGFVCMDYTRRMEPARIIAALKDRP